MSLQTLIRTSANGQSFVICNEGYTIERYIHGMEAGYNDVGLWRYKDLVAAFGAKEGTYKTYQIKTRQEVQDLLLDEDFASGNSLRVRSPYQALLSFKLISNQVC